MNKVLAAKNLLAAGAAALALSSAAQAAVVSVSVDIGGAGSWVNYGGGGQIGKNSFDTDGVFYTMDEAQGATLGAAVAVDGGAVAAGTAVDSHYLWFDPQNSQRAKATISFSGTILGVIITRAGLLASEGLGLASVTYLYPAMLGIEGRDSYSIAGNTLSIDWRASTPGDHIRVLTAAPVAAVPVPAAGGVLALGLGALALLRRRKAA